MLLCRLFYDLFLKELKYKHNIAGAWNINYVDSTFYALSLNNNVQHNQMYFFDSDGNFLEENVVHKNFIMSRDWGSGSMCRHKNILYIADCTYSILFKFLE